RSGAMARSCVDTMYQVGIVFHAAAGRVAPNTEPLTGFWVAARTRASGVVRSLQNTSWNLARSMYRKPAASGTKLSFAGGGGNLDAVAVMGSFASGANAAT